MLQQSSLFILLSFKKHMIETKNLKQDQNRRHSKNEDSWCSSYSVLVSVPLLI